MFDSLSSTTRVLATVGRRVRQAGKEGKRIQKAKPLKDPCAQRTPRPLPHTFAILTRGTSLNSTSLAGRGLKRCLPSKVQDVKALLAC